MKVQKYLHDLKPKGDPLQRPMAEMGEGEVKLFRTWSSAYGLRITWALKLKGIQYENIDEDLSNKSPLLLMYNPIHKKIPVLLHNGKAIAESAVILEYIDETWKKNPILPQDPYERAMARFIAKFGDDKVSSSLKFSIVCVEIRNTGFNDSLILIGNEYGYSDSLLDVDYMDHLIWLKMF